MKRKIFLLLILLTALFSARAQTAAVAGEKTKIDDAELRRQSFEKVWTTVNEKHYDQTFGGVDWKKMREIYEPQAMQAKTLNDFHAVLRRMLDELKLSHFAVYTPAPKTTAVEDDGKIGAAVKLIDKQAIIYRIEKNSAAEKSGLRIGFAIEKINGKTIAELLAPLEKNLAERGVNENLKNIYREARLTNALFGKPSASVKLEVLNAKNERQTFNVQFYPANREMSEAVGNFPPQEMAFEAKRLENNIGYIHFNIWVVMQMPKIRQAIKDFADTKGIIFDLRGNPGGIGGMAPGLAGLLMSEQTSLGSMTGRETELKFIVYPQSNPYAGKIVVLTDGGTGSTSEIFAAGMQELGRAKIVGERSAGAVLPSVFDTLPTGAIFQYAVSDYKSPKNILIEGRGVVPDIEIKQTRRSLLEGRDAPLDTAIKQILN